MDTQELITSVVVLIAIAEAFVNCVGQVFLQENLQMPSLVLLIVH